MAFVLWWVAWLFAKMWGIALVVGCCSLLLLFPVVFLGGLGERLCAFLTAFDCCVELTLKNFTIYNGVVCEKCVTFVVGN